MPTRNTTALFERSTDKSRINVKHWICWAELAAADAVCVLFFFFVFGGALFVLKIRLWKNDCENKINTPITATRDFVLHSVTTSLYAWCTTVLGWLSFMGASRNFSRGGQTRVDWQKWPNYRRAAGASENLRDFFGVVDSIYGVWYDLLTLWRDVFHFVSALKA